MKKNLSLKTIMLMSLALGSVSFMEAYGGCNKYADKDMKNNGQCAKDKKVAKDKESERSIKDEYRSIRREFDQERKKNHSAAVAKAKSRLKVADKKAKQFDVKIEKDEKNKTAAGVHKDSLKGMSNHLHEHIAKCEREHKQSKE